MRGLEVSSLTNCCVAVHTVPVHQRTDAEVAHNLAGCSLAVHIVLAVDHMAVDCTVAEVGSPGDAVVADCSLDLAAGRTQSHTQAAEVGNHLGCSFGRSPDSDYCSRKVQT